MLRIGTIISVSNNCNVDSIRYAGDGRLIEGQSYVVIGHYQSEADSEPWCYTLKNCHDMNMSSDIIIQMYDVHACIEEGVITVTFYPKRDATYSAEKIEEYIRNDGIRCPMCQSTDIVGDAWDVDATIHQQEMSCSECGESWVSVYELKTIMPRN